MYQSISTNATLIPFYTHAHTHTVVFFYRHVFNNTTNAIFLNFLTLSEG